MPRRRHGPQRAERYSRSGRGRSDERESTTEPGEPPPDKHKGRRAEREQPPSRAASRTEAANATRERRRGTEHPRPQERIKSLPYPAGKQRSPPPGTAGHLTRAIKTGPRGTADGQRPRRRKRGRGRPRGGEGAARAPADRRTRQRHKTLRGSAAAAAAAKRHQRRQKREQRDAERPGRHRRGAPQRASIDAAGLCLRPAAGCYSAVGIMPSSHGGGKKSWESVRQTRTKTQGRTE